MHSLYWENIGKSSVPAFSWPGNPSDGPLFRLQTIDVVDERQDFVAHINFRINKWAAAGFKDTLLRCSMKREVLYGYEKAIQPGIQV